MNDQEGGDNAASSFPFASSTKPSSKGNTSELTDKQRQGGYHADIPLHQFHSSAETLKQTRDSTLDDIVDFEVEPEDACCYNQKPAEKKLAEEKPQPAKISWNAWAGADHNQKAPAGEDKKDDSLKDVQRIPVPNPRKPREDKKERHYKDYIHKPHKKSVKDFGGDRSVRRRYREPRPRVDSVPIDNISSGGVPPGVRHGNASPVKRYVHSEVMDPAREPVERGMPPGLGGPGSYGRRPHGEYPPVDRRFPPREPIVERNFPPYPVRRVRQPRDFPDFRYEYRRSRSPTPEPPEVHPRPIHRPRSPYGGPEIQEDRFFVRRRPVFRYADSPPPDRRVPVQPARVRDGAPASPRRVTLPDRRQFMRPHNAGYVAPEYMRPPKGPPVGLGSPPREFQRRQNRPFSGLPRYSPPIPSSHRRRIRDQSPIPRPPMHLRRREEPVRDRLPQERDYPNRFYGPRGHLEMDRKSSMPGYARDMSRSPPRRGKRPRPNASDERYMPGPLQSRSLSRGNSESNGYTGIQSHHSETECVWYYVDPQGNTQGPCTIQQFRSWLRTLAEDDKFADEHKQFMSVDVWKAGLDKKYIMTELLENNTA